MKNIFMVLACGILLTSGCKKSSHMYSVSSLDHEYEYDPAYDYKGYNPSEDLFLYRTYQPDPNNGMVKKTIHEVEEEEI